MLFLNNEEQTSKKKNYRVIFFYSIENHLQKFRHFREKKTHTHTINIQINHTYILGIEMALPWNGGSGERISLTIKGDYSHLHLKRFTVLALLQATLLATSNLLTKPAYVQD